MKTKLLFLSLAVCSLFTTLPASSATPAAASSIVLFGDYQDGYDSGQTVRASLLFDAGGNPHNQAFLAAVQDEVDAAYIYRQGATTQGDYNYWDGYIAGISKR
ncbi:hypothetical protein [Hymenobacter rigui]|uniref:Uncharacterized protein n=1 Tax=Hymenobacter rigui TaxID=334424 RepID=A0A428KUA9_9BACT|nr:hypothetical protein [Hymenobacter rigui]RSK50093.1 hypothetical protein EI291_05430 [Hymenobacter rigui]